MSESKRTVTWSWDRPPDGPFLDKTVFTPPDGQRTPNGQIWGHSLDDLFWFPRAPGVDVLTIWSRSMIREFGECYDDNEHKREPPPRKRKPWPLLKLPKRMKAESRKYGFGVVDPGSDSGDSDDDGFKCQTVLIDVDSDNEEKARLLSNRVEFKKLLKKGFNKDWPPGRKELVHEALRKGKISIHDGPKLIVFKDISEAYFFAKLDCPTCFHFGPLLCPECTVNPPPVIYVVRYNIGKPKFIEDRKGKSTAWFADPNMPCIFSAAISGLGAIAPDRNYRDACVQDGSLIGVLGTTILRIPGENVTGSKCKTCGKDLPDCEGCGEDTTKPISTKSDGNGKSWFADASENRPSFTSTGMSLPSTDPKVGGDDPKFGASPLLVDAPDPLLKGLPESVLSENTLAIEKSGAIQAGVKFDGERLADRADNVTAATDKKSEKDNADSAATSEGPGSPLPTKPPNMPPCLEEEIPLEFFPDILIVKDAAGGIIRYHSSHRTPVADEHSSILDKPVKFRRVLPSPRTADDPKQQSSSSAQPLRVAELCLSLTYRLGRGNHSDVYLVPLRLPRPLSARTPTGEVSVACKMAHDRSYEARELLENEARIYASLPSHMFEEWNGYNLLSPYFRHRTVPVGPVVPKFYGYYKAVYDPEYYAEDEEDLDEESKESLKAFIEGLSPILLMEHCGEQINPTEMPEDDRDECMSLLYRLHLVGYRHNSAHIRNIVVQPGPLTLPPHRRSLKDPSFRMIDFGRTVDFVHDVEQRKHWGVYYDRWYNPQLNELRNLGHEIRSRYSWL
ncbi:uncharacterized protein EI90DRAFT_3121968 [Cantharellus anzutake]|uniref:uncharacterized protein n=1 Tax=Cantharellus anzutake TaxID=1750568 RepID=UPI001905A2F2|nr:uncharacterized protein EI90DRAFT_3121968 [Cantharellus anzutake]KAF8333619.1 hypothetical protein EI90DRAFT_3121968 [Cantharellus anzutake]